MKTTRQQSKRQSLREKQRSQTRRNRMLLVGGVVLLALIVVLAVVLRNPAPVTNSSTAPIVTVAPQTWPQADGAALGPKDAKVVVTEFADFQCPYCKMLHDTVFPELKKDYIDTGKIRYEYHHFIVIDGNVGGNESRRAAEASECAADQNRFWDYHNMLYANQQGEGTGAFSDARLKSFAAAIGLDTGKFNSCLDKGQFSQQVKADEARAAALGLRATPSLLVNNAQVQNPLDYTSLKAAIDAALNQ